MSKNWQLTVLYHSLQKKKLKSWFSASQILTHLRWRRRQHGLMAELVEGIICRRTLSNSIFGHKTHLPRFKEIYIYISNPINPFNKQREGVWVSGTQNSQKPPKIWSLKLDKTRVLGPFGCLQVVSKRLDKARPHIRHIPTWCLSTSPCWR